MSNSRKDTIQSNVEANPDLYNQLYEGQIIVLQINGKKFITKIRQKWRIPSNDGIPKEEVYLEFPMKPPNPYVSWLNIYLYPIRPATKTEKFTYHMQGAYVDELHWGL